MQEDSFIPYLTPNHLLGQAVQIIFMDQLCNKSTYVQSQTYIDKRID